MSWTRGLSPDFGRLLTVLRRQGEPDRVPFIELFADPEVMSAVIGEEIAEPQPVDRSLRERNLLRTIRFWHQCGYDYVPMWPTVSLPIRRTASGDTAALTHREREWQDESRGIINSWADFEAYPWPRPEVIDYFNLEFVSRHLPDGMKIIALGPGGQLEHIMWLMGYVPLAMSLEDDPALVQAVAEKVGEVLVTLYTTAAQIPNVGALWIGDDMGFKTATMVGPPDLRRFVFPWLTKIAGIAHERGVPFLLHSCGNLSQIMDELIDTVGIDAKHSFEDAIQPVAEAKRLYGDRIALLGGADVDFLSRSTEDEVRAYTRRLIDQCAPGGGWALGTGNSVANYIPLANYLAMLDEGLKRGGYTAAGGKSGSAVGRANR
ncbi:MAG: uroporphyrinogen decarboxylase family protein [Spirochaetia bacterium]